MILSYVCVQFQLDSFQKLEFEHNIRETTLNCLSCWIFSHCLWVILLGGKYYVRHVID